MIVDASAFVGEWPFRRLLYTTPEKLLRKMDELGVEKAVISRLENVFYKDLLVGNRELFDIVHQHPDRFIRAYTINPAFPGWEEDLEICRNDLGMRVLRLHPNYHAYRLMDECNIALMKTAQQHGFVIIITIGMEDERHHHWLAKVPDVDISQITSLVNSFPEIRFLISGGKYREVTAVWNGAGKRDNLFVEVARVQGPQGDIEGLCKLMGADHVLFASHLPLIVPESPKMSIEMAEIAEADKQKIFSGNAERLYGG